jgi:hypothetical protein
MSYPINYPTPQGANVQIFNFCYRSDFPLQVWTKPQGASMVWITLIAGGGGGGGTDGTVSYRGGGSSAVNNLMIPAFLIPDKLEITVGGGGAGAGGAGGTGSNGDNTYLFCAGQIVMQATKGNGGGTTTAAGGTASGASALTAAGFFQSVAGQAGVTSTNSASTTTFLSGGGSQGAQTANYGYNNGVGDGGVGYFQMSPIIIGVGGNTSSDGFNSPYAKGGIGCGGGGSSNSLAIPIAGSDGGNGLAVIITW